MAFVAESRFGIEQKLLRAIEKRLCEIDWRGVRSISLKLDWERDGLITVDTQFVVLDTDEDGKATR